MLWKTFKVTVMEAGHRTDPTAGDRTSRELRDLLTTIHFVLCIWASW